MQLGSNYGGWERNDHGYYPAQVDESPAKLPSATGPEPAKPQAPTM